MTFAASGESGGTSAFRDAVIAAIVSGSRVVRTV
jgi:hypothetical protein